MTTIKTPSPQQNNLKKVDPKKKAIAIYLGAALVGALLSLSLFVRSDWDKAIVIACVGYSLIASLFLIVQIWGFIVSQAFYSDSLEQEKFKILEIEASEWRV